MKHIALTAATAIAALTLAGCGDQSGGAGATRDQIRAVGSSTVYPFATAIAELFVQGNAGMKSPIIESTGTFPCQFAFTFGSGFHGVHRAAFGGAGEDHTAARGG